MMGDVSIAIGANAYSTEEPAVGIGGPDTRTRWQRIRCRLQLQYYWDLLCLPIHLGVAAAAASGCAFAIAGTSSATAYLAALIPCQLAFQGFAAWLYVRRSL